MELQDALARLSIIHDQVAKSEMYRGYRAWSIGASGILCIAAAALQPVWVDSPQRFVLFWCAVAIACAMVAASEIAINYFGESDPYHRQTTRRVVGQLVPCLVAGGAVTLALLRTTPETAALLPGLWAVIFGLGGFASRPYLPRATGYVALSYLIAGSWLLMRARLGVLPSPWTVGLTFGLGQLASAVVFYWNLERVQT